MKKRVFLLLQIAAFWLTIVSVSLGQKSEKYTFGDHIHFDFFATNTRGMVRTPSRYSANTNEVYKVFDHLNDSNSMDQNIVPKSPILLGVKLNPQLTDYFASDVKSNTKSFSSYLISDSSDAVLIALGITLENVNEYTYHVVENDSIEIVPWSPIPKMEQNYGAKQPYGFIGKFNSPGKQVMVEILNKKNYSIRAGVVFDWRINYKPKITQILASTDNDFFNLGYPKRNHHYATKFDQYTGLPLDLKFPLDSVSQLTFYFKNNETLPPYYFYLIKSINGKRDSIFLDTRHLQGFYELKQEHFNRPGKYELVIKRYTVYWKSGIMTKIPFEVLDPSIGAQKFTIWQLLPYGLGTLLLFILIFVIYYLYNKRKLRIAAQQKELVNIRLKSIRSQLNPHFMFNALSSIQNLMNKKDIEGANHYLAKFSNLTREVLNTGEHELISLEDEIKMLNDYLQMEQLRFRFQYSIKVDENINKANVEIPAMLLQPFVENAVKHGISSLKENGVIDVLIDASDKDLILSVTDNGKGFAANIQDKERTSFGLKLSEERVALINQIYKDQKSTLNIDSKPTGTTITIRLNNWL